MSLKLRHPTVRADDVAQTTIAPHVDFVVATETNRNRFDPTPNSVLRGHIPCRDAAQAEAVRLALSDYNNQEMTATTCVRIFDAKRRSLLLPLDQLRAIANAI